MGVVCGSYNTIVYYFVVRASRLFIICGSYNANVYCFVVRTTRMFISLWFVQHDCLLFCGSYDVRVYYFVVRTTRMFLIFWFVQSKCLLFSDAKVYYFEIEGELCPSSQHTYVAVAVSVHGFSFHTQADDLRPPIYYPGKRTAEEFHTYLHGTVTVSRNVL